MQSAVRLGQFRLGEQIGEGGMGVVYRARHVETGVDVAVKVIANGGSRETRRRFQREVQAQAAMTHRGIVYLFEYGRVPAEVAERADDRLGAGSPFVAMELAEAGTLVDLMPLGDWPTLRRLLIQVLDALAYAHARDVVHRDLKPENFLVFDRHSEQEAAGPRIKLADFGIAHPIKHESHRDLESLEQTAGTPHYMSPEQAKADWRAYGPWTDLYAVGCITWELVCRRLPFRADSPLELLVEQMEAERPPLEPRFPVPDGLEEWVRRAMAIDPADRFRRAADAARALPEGRGLERPAARGGGAEARGGVEAADIADTLVDEAAILPTETLILEADELQGRGGDESAAPQEPTDPGLVDLPDSWRRGSARRIPAPLVGTGLGLFGMREVPFVDRDSEREAIWQTLHRAVERGERRLVLIVGETGAGKTHLAEWMATRADEVGAVDRLKATHTDGGDGRAEGLSGMVRRRFHTWKLGRREVYEHLEAELPPLDAEDSLRRADAVALTELIRPTDDDSDEVDGPRYRFSGPAQRYALIERLLGRIGRRRVPFLWIDDLQWSHETLGLVDYLVDQRSGEGPALVVGTLRADVLRERAGLAETVRRLADRPETLRIDLPSLGASDQRELLERMLPLEEGLADQLAERTEGNPLFAVQLLGHWVERGYVRQGDEGFTLSEGTRADIPADIHGLWRERLDRLVGTFPERARSDARRSIELAATLGREVDEAEWEAVCRDAGYAIPAELVDRMVERGLADRTEEGWTFAHRLLAESLHRLSREAGRLADHHRRCARVLEEAFPERTGETAGRRADHWIAAGEDERALAPLRLERERRHESGYLSAERSVLEQQRDILDRLGVAETDVRRIENEIELVACDVLAGRPVGPIVERVEEASERAEAIGAVRLLGRALLVAGRCYKRRGDFASSRARLARVRSLVEARSMPALEAKACFGLGSLKLESGAYDEAEALFEEARQGFRRVGDHYWQHQSQLALVQTFVFSGRVEQARSLLERLLDSVQTRGFRLLESIALNLYGELAKFEGTFGDARHHYRRSVTLAEQLGQKYAVANSRLNLIQIDVAEGRFAEGARRLAEVTRQLEAMDIEEKADLVALAKLGLAAGRRQWNEFDALLSPYLEGWPERAALERDHPWLLERAADYAAEAGQQERAERARRLARDLWRRLDN